MSRISRAVSRVLWLCLKGAPVLYFLLIGYGFSRGRLGRRPSPVAPGAAPRAPDRGAAPRRETN
jgi:hypothetical protein